jgi:uncharacterized membrane protein
MKTAKNLRINAIDTLRGIIMAIMLLDHVREFFYLHKQVTDPMDLTLTSPELFFTRFITHFCAPLFVFLSGLSVWMHAKNKDLSHRQTSEFLLKRGIFLVILEVSVVGFAWTFSLSPDIIYFQVIWAIGCSMIALSLLIWLPWYWILSIAVVIIAGHNTLDQIHFTPSQPYYPLWAILHDRSMIDLSEGLKIRTSYPILPWIGIISLGYVFGRFYDSHISATQRIAWFRNGAIGALAFFILLRSINIYGDLHTRQLYEGTLLNLMSFINLTKYPPSLDFILLTIGVGVLSLSFLERYFSGHNSIFTTFGRVPLFFYILHLYVLHLFYLIASTFIFETPIESIWMLWMIAFITLLVLYIPSKLFGNYKQKHKPWWGSYV